ncbi:hypothetical protein B0A64_22810 [Flavobacterium araucananum]|uniref:Uncharacterized protein n=1 Tax=Flavobacterium araucananum TaxID=946678 RepID=A0A227NJZ2_9FLAO|nr:hypothetical protein B0A64_22810 [Flavobacterium araucananum]
MLIPKKVTVFQTGFDTILNEKAFKHDCLKAFCFLKLLLGLYMAEKEAPEPLCFSQLKWDFAIVFKNWVTNRSLMKF